MGQIEAPVPDFPAPAFCCAHQKSDRLDTKIYQAVEQCAE
jgi:hypothetical protein